VRKREPEVVARAICAAREHQVIGTVHRAHQQDVHTGKGTELWGGRIITDQPRSPARRSTPQALVAMEARLLESVANGARTARGVLYSLIAQSRSKPTPIMVM